MSNIIRNIQALINDFKVKVLLPEEKVLALVAMAINARDAKNRAVVLALIILIWRTYVGL